MSRAGRDRWNLAWLVAIAVVGIGLGILSLIPTFRVPADGTTGTLVGMPAPMLEVADLSGRTRSLADADGRIVWVNFWASWCPPCRTEMPAMQVLAEEYGDRLLILGVNWGEERDAVEEFVERYGIEYPILLDPSLDTFYRWASDNGLPRHYFIGPDGLVVREAVGPLDPSRMVEILDELVGPA